MLVQKLIWIILLLFLCRQGVEAKRAVVCEGGFMKLRCLSGVIKINKANYGRTDRTTCTRGILDVHTSNMNCFQRSSLRIMSHRCNARKRCSVHVANTVFSDPCAWTYKYLDVDFICV
ncbi:L-rhamnose-binding lectin CSL3-like [Carassius gibelio]|uniref:L-rhamnose-binding lectin CSL3-like n=1 Tax=Carassius gibelio TaxID=101364 RepID=UPI0022799FE8|nr:L-rhamnose-binding lectin CSL3-like [Carassius gibelio]